MVDVDTPGVSLPPVLNYGLRSPEKALLFSHLPILTAELESLQANEQLVDRSQSSPNPSTGEIWTEVKRVQELELGLARERANRLARLVDLRNASAKGVMHENRRRIVEAFGRDGKDTGRPEVQGTYPFAIHSL